MLTEGAEGINGRSLMNRKGEKAVNRRDPGDG
jgi:hypothetical protein